MVQKGKSEMTDAERNRMQAEIRELQKTVSVSEVCCWSILVWKNFILSLLLHVYSW